MNYIYQPTPIEEAYAYYLIRTVFPSSFSNTAPNIATTTTNSSSSSNNNIRVSGKYMVPFLSKSNLSRPLLRDIWSLIDPKALGYISTIQPQFIMILRYISILQNQLFLHSDTNDTNNDHHTSITNENKKDLLYQCLIQTCHRTDLSLAQFEGYTIPPSHELLLFLPPLPLQSSPLMMSIGSTTTATTTTITPDMLFTPTVSSISTSSIVTLPTPVNTSNYEFSSTSTPVAYDNDPFTSINSITATDQPIPVHHQEQQQLPSVTTTLTAENHTNMNGHHLDVWGAFDALTTVVDAPLPTLSSSLPATTTGMTLPLSQEVSPSSATYEQTTTTNGTAVTTTTTESTEGVVPTEDDDDDDFGDFHDTSTITITNALQTAQPDTIVAAPMRTMNDESDGFGDFVAPPPPPTTTMTTTMSKMEDATVLNGWGALDALVDETNKIITPSLPSMLFSVDDVTTTTPTHTPMDFTNATTTAASSANVSIHEFPADSEYSGITSTTTALTQQHRSGWDTLGSLTTPIYTDNNLHHPEAQPTQSLHQPIKTIPEVIEDESDGFGDFVSPNGNIDTMSATVDENFDRSKGQQQLPENGWDALDALVESSPTVAVTGNFPMPLLCTTDEVVEQVEDELFDDFVSPNDIATQQLPPDTVETTANIFLTSYDNSSNVKEVQQLNVVESGWDALDALASITTSDTMIAPLQSMTHECNEITNVSKETESEGFGDFVSPESGAANTTSVNDIKLELNDSTKAVAIEQPLVDFDGSGWDALDALASTITSEVQIPAPQLFNHEIENTDGPKETNEGFPELLGPSNDATQIDVVVAGVEALAPASTANDVTSPLDENIASSEHQMNIGNGWDALDALVSTSDNPLPPLQSLHQEEINSSIEVNESESEGFGDFVGTTDVIATELVVDSFDVLANVTEESVTTFPLKPQFSHPSNAIASAETHSSMAINHAINLEPIIIPNQKNLSDIGCNHDINGTGNDLSDWGALHNPVEINDKLLDNFGIISNGHLPLQSAGIMDTASDDVGDEFGDFVGEEGAPTSLVLSEPTCDTIVDDDPFHALGPSEQATLSRPIIMYDRADSTYYSAQAKSVSSDSDYNNYEDATMNDSEVDTINAETNQVGATDVDHDFVQEFHSSNAVVDSEDLLSMRSSGFVPEPTSSLDQQSKSNVESIIEADVVQEVDTEEFDAFTDFQGISERIDVATDDAFDDDDFGAFETVSNSVAIEDNRSPDEKDKTDEFGNFDDFGAFENSVPSTASTLAMIDASPSGCREIKAGFVVVCDEDWIRTREQVIIKGNHLPEHLRQTLHGMIDFGACFDSNIQRKFPLSESRIHQILRSVNLMDRLSSRDGENISAYWVQLLAVIKKELSKGAVLLQDATKLDTSDLAFVVNHLKRYVRGLKEYVRVSRCITATMADLFMLDVFTMLSNETLQSSFQSSNIATEAYEIERLWDKFYLHDERLALNVIDSKANRLEDMVEIRSRLFDNAIDTALCDFTLQPLPSPIKIDSTQNIVTWSEKTYIVCAANLLSNTTDYFTRKS